MPPRLSPPSGGSLGCRPEGAGRWRKVAEAYFRYAPDTEKAALARRILAKAAEFGVHVQSPTIRIWAEKP